MRAHCGAACDRLAALVPTFSWPVYASWFASLHYSSFWELSLWVPVLSGGGSLAVVAGPPPRTGVVQPWLDLWGMLAEGWGGWGFGFCVPGDWEGLLRILLAAALHTGCKPRLRGAIRRLPPQFICG